MGAAEAVGLVMTLLQTAWGAAKNMGLVGNPDWLKYADAGMFMAQRAKDVLLDIFMNPTKYDKMTPEEIKSLLMPLTWDEIEAAAAKQIAAESLAPVPAPAQPTS